MVDFNAGTVIGGALVISAGIFGACMLLYNIVNRRESSAHASASGEADTESEAPLAKGGGFGLVFKTRYLLLIALMTMKLKSPNSNNTSGIISNRRLIM